MRDFLFTIIALSILVGCSQKVDAAVSKSDILAWGESAVGELTEIYPLSFSEMHETLEVSEQLELNKLKLQYDTKANGEVSITEADKQLLIDIGIISSVAEYCEMDWAESHFLPMMQWQRGYLPESERNGVQIAIVGAIHGYAQGSMDKWLMENDALCNDVRKILDGNLFQDQL